MSSSTLEPDAPITSGRPRSAQRWRVGDLPGWIPWVGVLAGVPLITWSYSYADTHAVGDQIHYALFWAGMLLCLVPMFIRQLGHAPSRYERLLLTISAGVITYVPKFLRSPDGILYHDEWAQIHQAILTERYGRLGVYNPTILIISHFPGLSALTAFIHEVTGLGQGATVATIIGGAHVVGLVAIFLLAESVFGSARAGALAALLYTLNSSYLYFDTEYAYESLALPFAFWTLVAVTRFRAAATVRDRRGWLALAVVLFAACGITHHITTYILVLVLLGLAALSYFRKDSRPLDGTRATVGFAIFALLFAVLYAVLFAPGVAGYLLPRVTSGFQELVHGSVRSTHGKAHLFQSSHIPEYERACAIALLPLAALVWIGALLYLRKRWRNKLQRFDDMQLAMIGLGCLYVPSFPLLLSLGGAEGARRSWATSYLGLAILVAPWVIYLWDKRPRFALRTYTAVLFVFIVTLIGGVAIGIDEYYRFPGPYVYGTDTRSVTPELRDISATFPEQWGWGNKTIADRYNGLLVGTVGEQQVALPSVGFPAWNLYFDKYPSEFLLGELITSHQKFMVIDSNMAKYLPDLGVYFDPEEPLADYRTKPVPALNLIKYEYLPWTIKVLTTNHLSVYRYDFNAITAPEGIKYRAPGTAAIAGVPGS